MSKAGNPEKTDGREIGITGLSGMTTDTSSSQLQSAWGQVDWRWLDNLVVTLVYFPGCTHWIVTVAQGCVSM